MLCRDEGTVLGPALDAGGEPLEEVTESTPTDLPVQLTISDLTNAKASKMILIRCDLIDQHAGHSDRPNGPLFGLLCYLGAVSREPSWRALIWSASNGRTYERKRSGQSTAKRMTRRGHPHMGLSRACVSMSDCSIRHHHPRPGLRVRQMSARLGQCPVHRKIHTPVPPLACLALARQHHMAVSVRDSRAPEKGTTPWLGSP